MTAADRLPAGGKRVSLHAVIAVCVWAAALVVYLLTVAPTVSFWDNGEFLTVSAVMGVPHPPGSPLLTLTGRFAALVPSIDVRTGAVGSTAYRVNLVAAFSAAFAVLLIYLITFRLIRRIIPPSGSLGGDWPACFGGALAACAAAFSNQFWENAVEFETYMPGLLLSLLALWLALRWDDRRGEPGAVRDLFLASYLVGLGIGVHLTVLLVLPAVLVLVVRFEGWNDVRLWLAAAGAAGVFFATRLFLGREALMAGMFIIAAGGPFLAARFSGRFARPLAGALAAGLVCIALAFIGYSVYPTIAVRAAKNPSINEGDPDTRARYAAYLDREQYGQGTTSAMLRSMFSREAGFGYQFGFMYARYLLQQLPAWGPVAEIGFSNDRSADRPGETVPVRETVPLSIGLWLLVIAGIVVHAARDRRSFGMLLVFFLVTSIGLVLYLNMKNPQVRERDYFFLGSYMAVMIWLGIGSAAMVRGVCDGAARWSLRSAPFAACAAGLLLLTIIPAAAMSDHIERGVSNWRLHDRSRNWIARDTAANLLETCAPNAILFTNGDNDTYPLWYLQEAEGVRRDVRVVNMSLLNAPWYISQLRDDTPEIPIAYSDKEIEGLANGGPSAGTLHLWDPEPREVIAGGLVWKMPPNDVGTLPDGRKVGILSTAAVMTRHIIERANGSRPIYFAVTVNPDYMIGLFEHMSIEGSAFRLVNERAADNEYLIDAPTLERNLFSRYRYRGLSDSTVYKPPDTRRILRNYFVAFARLSERYLRDGRTADGIRVAHEGVKICNPDPEIRVLLYTIFAELGLRDELFSLADDEIRRIPPGDTSRILETGMRFLGYSMPVLALRMTEPLIAGRTKDYDIWRLHVGALYTAGRYDDALAALGGLLALVPGDSDALRLRQMIMERKTAPAVPDTVSRENTR